MAADVTIITFVTGTIVLVLFSFALVAFLVVHKKKRYQHLLEKQQMESTYENQLLQTKLEVQEQSFKHFSEEIHDNVGQLLSVVKMQLYNIAGSSNEPEIGGKAAESTELLGKAINELRSISHTLNSAYITSVGLIAATRKELEYIASAGRIETTLNVYGQDVSLGNERELLVFRIIQEAVANSIKHASPTRISISIAYDPLMAAISIADNGAGFDVDAFNAGLGLANMHIRAGLLKGTISIESVKDEGTTIKLAVPVTHT